MPASSPFSLPPSQDLARLSELLRSLEDACARMDAQLRRLELMPASQPGSPATSHFQGDKQPWSLFEAAPEVAAARGRQNALPTRRIPPQPVPQLSSELERCTLERLNRALGAAFDQAVRGSST